MTRTFAATSPRVRAVAFAVMIGAASAVFVPRVFAGAGDSTALLVSRSAQRTNAAPLRDSKLSGSVAIFAAVTRPRVVNFWLDDPLRQRQPLTIDGAAPYDLLGSSRDGRARMLDTRSMANGPHTLTAVVRYSRGTQVVLSNTFTVTNGTATPSDPGTTTTTTTPPPTTPPPTTTTTTTSPPAPPEQPQPPAPPESPPSGEPWAPSPGEPWQIQLSGTIDMSVDVPIYDVDGFGTSAAQVAQLHALGRRAICYVDVGGWENYRSDAGAYPSSVLGQTVGGWPDERWIDIRQWNVVGPLIAARFDMCAAKGFDAIDPDLLDAWQAKSGFPLTYADQITFNSRVAALAHDRGMSIALKGDVDQAKDLVSVFDFTINEECVAWSECKNLSGFIAAGKAVLHIEYDFTPSQFCPVTQPLGFSSLQKRLGLDSWRATC